MRKLFLMLLALFALFVLINTYAGVVADKNPAAVHKAVVDTASG